MGRRRDTLEFLSVPVTPEVLRMVKRVSRHWGQTPRQWLECVVAGYASEQLRKIERAAAGEKWFETTPVAGESSNRAAR